MDLTEEKVSFDQMPQVVSELKQEIGGRAKTRKELDQEALEYVQSHKAGRK